MNFDKLILDSNQVIKDFSLIIKRMFLNRLIN